MPEAPALPITVDGLEITEVEDIRLFTLRFSRTAAIPAAVAEALGRALPETPNTVGGDAVQLLWQAPREWLIVGRGPDLAPAMTRLSTACAACTHHLGEVTDGRTVVEIAGTHARDFIAKGCSLDLHPRVFGVGRCAQTLLAQIHGLLQQTSDEPCFRFIFDSSLADYLRMWMHDTALEFIEPSRA